MISSIYQILGEAAFGIAKIGVLAFCASTTAGIFAMSKGNLMSIADGKSRGYQEPTLCRDGRIAITAKKIAIAVCLYGFFKL